MKWIWIFFSQCTFYRFKNIYVLTLQKSVLTVLPRQISLQWTSNGFGLSGSISPVQQIAQRVKLFVSSCHYHHCIVKSAINFSANDFPKNINIAAVYALKVR